MPDCGDGSETLRALGIPTENCLGATVRFRAGKLPQAFAAYFLPPIAEEQLRTVTTRFVACADDMRPAQVCSIRGGISSRALALLRIAMLRARARVVDEHIRRPRCFCSAYGPECWPHYWRRGRCFAVFPSPRSAAAKRDPPFLQWIEALSESILRTGRALCDWILGGLG